MSDRTFEFLLNAMENAAQSSMPAENRYADKRRAVFAYEAALRAERDALRVERYGLIAEIDQLRPIVELAARYVAVANKDPNDPDWWEKRCAALTRLESYVGSRTRTHAVAHRSTAAATDTSEQSVEDE